MTVSLVVPVLDDRGLDAQLSEHFGRAPYFAVIDVADDGRLVAQDAVAHVSEHVGGVGRPIDRILQLKPTALITSGLGPRAFALFQQAPVTVLHATASPLRT